MWMSELRKIANHLKSVSFFHWLANKFLRLYRLMPFKLDDELSEALMSYL